MKKQPFYLMRKNSTGFTIVELLIVIVVIAILAAIAITAYAGIQVRAKDTKQLSEVKQFIKQLEMYRSEHGTLPTPVPAGDVALYDQSITWSVSEQLSVVFRKDNQGPTPTTKDREKLQRFEDYYKIKLPDNTLYYSTQNLPGYSGVPQAYVMSYFNSSDNIPEENQSNRRKAGSNNPSWGNHPLFVQYSACNPSAPLPASASSTTSYGSTLYPVYTPDGRISLSTGTYYSGFPSNPSYCNTVYLREYMSGANANLSSGVGLFTVQRYVQP